jgi:hypothetical protein
MDSHALALYYFPVMRTYRVFRLRCTWTRPIANIVTTATTATIATPPRRNTMRNVWAAGAFVGAFVVAAGAAVPLGLGGAAGSAVGDSVGAAVPLGLGDSVGAAVPLGLGDSVGDSVGAAVPLGLGAPVVGATVGNFVGCV